MMQIQPLTLTGNLVSLEPLAAAHHDGLVAAVQDGELWKLWYTSIPDPEGMAEEIQRRLSLQEQGVMLAFTVRRRDTGAVIGMTTYMNIDAVNHRLEIGSTFNAAGSQRSGTNAESKLLLLTQAFETLECIAVEFRTHAMNLQSRDAIARLGAKQDGVLRSHQRLADGSLRDTVVFSILASEWLTVKRGLEFRLSRRP